MKKPPLRQQERSNIYPKIYSYSEQIYCIIFETALQSEHIFDGCYFYTLFE